MTPFVDTLYFQYGFSALLCMALVFSIWKIIRSTKRSKSSLGLIDLINLELPQTQCGHCGHAGCLPYARAIANGEAINKCVPGGPSTVRRLSTLLNQQLDTVDPAHGTPGARLVAIIGEEECIGCTKCIQACPVDAILGAAKLMHTVINSECTGCDLCVDPCPVDCIDLVLAQKNKPYWLLPALNETMQADADTLSGNISTANASA